MVPWEGSVHLPRGNGGGGGGAEIRARGQRCLGRVQSAEGAVGAM